MLNYTKNKYIYISLRVFDIYITFQILKYNIVHRKEIDIYQFGMRF